MRLRLLLLALRLRTLCLRQLPGLAPLLLFLLLLLQRFVLLALMLAPLVQPWARLLGGLARGLLARLGGVLYLPVEATCSLH